MLLIFLEKMKFSSKICKKHAKNMQLWGRLEDQPQTPQKLKNPMFFACFLHVLGIVCVNAANFFGENAIFLENMQKTCKKHATLGEVGRSTPNASKIEKTQCFLHVFCMFCVNAADFFGENENFLENMQKTCNFGGGWKINPKHLKI